MKIKVSDYIIEFLISKQISDVFGYPGGMVTHLMDSFYKYEKKIKAHINYNEQASAFAACGYAQVSGKPGVAYATSGPGATNLITGIANAYFDSIPTMFITGQVNTYEAKWGELKQRGFQETDIINIVKPIVKKAYYISNPEEVPKILEDAYQLCMTDRKGPVLLDIPMNIQRSEITRPINSHVSLYKNGTHEQNQKIEEIRKLINYAKRPVFILGNGIHSMSQEKLEMFLNNLNIMNIPVVTSMVAIDLLTKENHLNYGFLGAYGSRVANFIVAKADLLITIGTRLDIRQVGGKTENFSIKAKLIRFDVDESEFTRKIKEDEIQIFCDVDNVLDILTSCKINIKAIKEWRDICDIIKMKLLGYDDREYNKIISQISEHINDNTVITTDVGQNQVWVAQSFQNKKNQKILFSGGHGAMGYSLPAAIGAYYATGKPVVSFNGDGGLQMNIQEMQFIARESIPVKIIVLNNSSLGMIRHFQEMYFDSIFYQTTNKMGYSNPQFSRISKAYGIRYEEYLNQGAFDFSILNDDKPCLVEIKLNANTYVYPKLAMDKLNQDQEPELDRNLYEEIMLL